MFLNGVGDVVLLVADLVQLGLQLDTVRVRQLAHDALSLETRTNCPQKNSWNLT